MDFVSRHANTSINPSSSSSSSSSASASTSYQNAPSSPPRNHLPQLVALEEPEYLARYFVVKHSWRGRYKRILCITDSSIITLDPNTLSVTNAYETSSDFEGATPVLGRDDGSHEFTISVRTDGRGKFKGIKLSSKFRVSILTELHRLKWSRTGSVAEFPVLHLRRRTSEWAPYVCFDLVQFCLSCFP